MRRETLKVHHLTSRYLVAIRCECYRIRFDSVHVSFISKTKVIYASGEMEAAGSVGNAAESISIFLLGLLSSSKVTPSNFVIPTTGGSPFFTNSYIPVKCQYITLVSEDT